MRSRGGRLLRPPKPPLTAGWITTTTTAASGIWRSYPLTNITTTSPQVSTPPVCCRYGSNENVLDLGSTLILFWVKSGSDTVRPHPLQQRLAVHRAGGDSKTDLDDLIISAVQPNTVDLQSRIDLRLGEEVRAENCSDFSHIVQSCG